MKKWLPGKRAIGLILIGWGAVLLSAGGFVCMGQYLEAAPATPPPLGMDENPLPFVDYHVISNSQQAQQMPVPVTASAAATQEVTSSADSDAEPPDRIVAKSIELDSPVVSVGWHTQEIDGQSLSVWDVPEYAAGWLENSAKPGEPGNIVISGHHNVKGEVFRRVIDLKLGDKITLYVKDKPYDYAVKYRFILKDKGEPIEVRFSNARWIGPFEDERLTLVTCWPYTSNTHRLIVIAKPVKK